MGRRNRSNSTIERRNNRSNSNNNNNNNILKIVMDMIRISNSLNINKVKILKAVLLHNSQIGRRGTQST